MRACVGAPRAPLEIHSLRSLYRSRVCDESSEYYCYSSCFSICLYIYILLILFNHRYSNIAGFYSKSRLFEVRIDFIVNIHNSLSFKTM